MGRIGSVKRLFDAARMLFLRGNPVARAARRRIKRMVTNKMYIYFKYKYNFGIYPDLKKPRTFNEKICCRKIYPDPIFSQLTDKVKVRGYVEGKLGGKYLVPVYAICKELTEEIYDALPESFMMKANHGCGYNLIVNNKQEAGFAYLKEVSDSWLSSNYYQVARELHYKDIKPQLVFEKLLMSENEGSPLDFKFFCFRRVGHQPVVFIEVSYDRLINYKVDYYDCNWNRVEVVEDRFVKCGTLEKPCNLDEALKVALALSEGFSFVRVDLYMLKDAIYFGEMTFTPTAGGTRFKSERINEEWGRLFEK